MGLRFFTFEDTEKVPHYTNSTPTTPTVEPNKINYITTMEDPIIEKLRKFESKTPNNWRKEAEFMRQNDYWLTYSFKIAVKMLRRMRELGLSQQEVADQLECTEEYVTRILSGKENLTLKTIAKIEEILGLKFFAFKD